MRETWVRALAWEDPLEKEMAIHSSTLAWKIPWTEEPGRLVYGVTKSQTQLSDFTFTFSSSKLDVTPRLFHLYKGNSTKVTVGIINVKLCYLLL